jgi:hypothetical protein
MQYQGVTCTLLRQPYGILEQHVTTSTLPFYQRMRWASTPVGSRTLPYARACMFMTRHNPFILGHGRGRKLASVAAINVKLVIMEMRNASAMPTANVDVMTTPNPHST